MNVKVIMLSKWKKPATKQKACILCDFIYIKFQKTQSTLSDSKQICGLGYGSDREKQSGQIGGIFKQVVISKSWEKLM